jgi:O-antigen/teichoic acid export membrane protein
MVIANASALVVAVVLAFALVPSHGAKGGALATVIGEGTLFLCEIAVLLRAGRYSRPPARAPHPGPGRPRT